MLKRIKTFIHSLKYLNSDALPLQHIEPTQEVKKHKVPFSQEQMCAMRPHDFDCPIIGCKKDPCFVRVPDKIVKIKKTKAESKKIAIEIGRRAKQMVRNKSILEKIIKNGKN